jgi:hypothetical protein
LSWCCDHLGPLRAVRSPPVQNANSKCIVWLRTSYTFLNHRKTGFAQAAPSRFEAAVGAA